MSLFIDQNEKSTVSLRATSHRIGLLLASLPLWACTDEIPTSELAARVNGAPILKSEFEAAARRRTAVYERGQQKLDTAVRDRIKVSVLRTLIERQVIATKAAELGVRVSDDELEARYTEHRRRWRSEEQFQSFLQGSGHTVASIKEDLRRTMLRDRVIERLSKPVDVSDEEVKAYYDKNPEAYVTEATRLVSRVVLPSEPSMSKAQKRASRGKAERIVQSARVEGVDFNEIARRYSGGDAKTQWLVPGQMPTTVEAEVFAIEPGAVSDVLRTPRGWEVFKVLESQPESHRSFKDVSGAIRSTLVARRRSEQRVMVLNRLGREAEIERFVEEPVGGSSDAVPSWQERASSRDAVQ